MGFPRASADDRVTCIPKILTGFSSRTFSHQIAIFHLFLQNLDSFSRSKLRDLSFTNDSKDSSSILRFFLDFLLYFPTKQKETPPLGLSKKSVDMITYNDKKEWSNDSLVQTKISIINFLSTDAFDNNLKMPHFVVSTCDPHHEIIEKAEDSLKKFNFNFEDQKLVQDLYSIYLGVKSEDLNNSRSEASPVLKAKLISYLARSVKASNQFPQVIQIIFDSVYGPTSNKRLKQVGMNFSVWVSRMSDEKVISASAPILLSGMIKFLKTEQDDSDILRGFAYTSISLLCKRVPKLLIEDFSILQMFFQGLATEPASVRLSIQEGLSVIMMLLKSAPEDVLSKLETLLFETLSKPEHQSRLIALKYANSIYRFEHISARYMCMVAASDENLEVREESKMGLYFAKQKLSLGISSDSLDSTYPDFKKLIRYLSKEIKNRTHELHKILGYRPDTYRAISKFCRDTLLHNFNPNSNLDALGQGLEIDEPIQLSMYLYANFSLQEDEDLLKEYVRILGAGLSKELEASICQESLDRLVEVLTLSPKIYSANLSERIDLLKQLGLSTRESIRESCAKLIGVILSRNDEQNVWDSTLDESVKTLREPKASHEQISFRIFLVGNLISESIASDKKIEDSKVYDSLAALNKFFASTHDHHFIHNVCVSVGEIGRVFCLPEYVTESLLSLLSNKDTKLVERAVSALGYASTSNHSFDLHKKVIAGFVELANKKNVELHFTVGESLSFLISGWKSKRYESLLITHPKFDHMEVESSPNPTLEEILKFVLLDQSKSERPDVRQANCIWLLSIIRFNSAEKGIQDRLYEMQGIFTRYLADKDEFTQDCASKAIGMIFDLGDEKMKSSLVSELVRGITGQTAVAKVDSNTQIFESELGSTPTGDQLTTYKELCSLASELNQPDLVYKFMSLANHSALWNTRKGASFGFTMIAKKAGEQLKEYLPSMVPKLYRYQFDPNQRIQDSMAAIWKALVPNPQQALEDNFKAIIEDLLQSMGHKTWRTREASAIALTNLLRGKNPEELDNYLEDCWKMATRVIDDVKESVRKAGFVTCKTLSSITIKICNENSKERGERAMKIIVPFILQKGILSEASEAKLISVELLVQVTKTSGKLLKPFVCEIVSVLLEGLSSMEPQAMNYLAFHVDKFDISQEQFENTRLAATKSSPIMNSIESCLEQVDSEIMEQLSPIIVQVIRKGVGLPTKAGCARVLSILSYKNPDLLKPHSQAIIKALSGAILDKSSTIRKAMANSIGRIIGLTSETTFSKLVQHLKKIYFETEEIEIKGVSAIVMLEISKHSNDLLKAKLNEAIPFIFFGMHDDEKETQTIWQECWEENTRGMASGVRTHFKEILPLLLEILDSQSRILRRQSALSVKDLMVNLKTPEEKSLVLPYSKDLVGKLSESLSGRTWKGKEAILESLYEVLNTIKSIDPKFELGAIVDIFFREANKNDKDYKRFSLEILGKLISLFECPVYKKVLDIAIPNIQRKGKNEDEDSDDEEAKKPLRVMVVSSSFKLISLAWPKSVEPEQEKQALDILTSNINGNVWMVQTSVIESLIRILTRLSSSGTKSLAIEYEDILFKELTKCCEETKYSALRLSSLKCLKLFSIYLDGLRRKLKEGSIRCIKELKTNLPKDLDAEILDTLHDIEKMSTKTI